MIDCLFIQPDARWSLTQLPIYLYCRTSYSFTHTYLFARITTEATYDSTMMSCTYSERVSHRQYTCLLTFVAKCVISCISVCSTYHKLTLTIYCFSAGNKIRIEANNDEKHTIPHNVRTPSLQCCFLIFISLYLKSLQILPTFGSMKWMTFGTIILRGNWIDTFITHDIGTQIYIWTSV